MIPFKLRIGDSSTNGQVTVVDEDRLCYLVRNTSKGAQGIRTISKALLDEFITYMQEHPDATANEAREDLSGKSELDKFEYGYASTLVTMARMVIDGKDVPHTDKTSGEKKAILLGADVSKTCFPYFSAIRTKPFLLLAGISGTGKSRIVRKLAQATTTEELEKKYRKDYMDGDLEKNRWNLHKPANFEIIQVKPNWHNSMDVVGYESNIPNPHYVFTPFVEFIAKAWQNPEVPFFLCLDEMNLAPVEEYFAEFLSAIESRSKCNGKYETDPIIKPFNTFGEKVCEQMVKGLFPGYDIHNATPELLKIVNRFKEKGLTLPENLIVIGTVNMDETTFSFSRKVLDRAMSFEMNEVDYDGFLNDAADIITEPLSAEVSLLLVDRIVDAREVKAEIDAEVVMSYLKAVNKTLDNTPFKLGYRAANEALLYVAASRSFGQESLATALDEFTTMKILSRIEGDTTKLRVDENSDRTILDELKAVIEKYLKEKGASEEGHTGESAEVDGGQQKAEPIKWKSLEKLERMRQQLKRNSFVSYWE